MESQVSLQLKASSFKAGMKEFIEV